MSAFNWDEADKFIETAQPTSAQPTSAQPTSEQPDWTTEADTFVGVDTSNMEMGSYTEGNVYVPPVGEDTGGTISTEEIWNRRDVKLAKQAGDDIEAIISATTSLWDNITDGSTSKESKSAIQKKEKELSKMLKEKYDIKVENRGGEKVMVLPNGRAVPYTEGNMLDIINSNRAEIGGAIAGGLAGAGTGAIAGPGGAIVGGVIGSAAGAYGASGLDVDRNVEKTGIEVSEDEKGRLQKHAGLTDAAAGVVLVGLGKILGKSVAKNFTTIADMPKEERKAVMHLAEKSGLNEEQMEQHIKEYARSTDVGEISTTSAVEAGAKGSEREEIGFATEAMKQDPLSKKNVIEETTKRTNIIEDALKQMDDEFETDQFSRMLKRHTLDDEGRRKATDWKGLAESMRQQGFDIDDPIYMRVKENADTFGTKETDIFRDTVKPASPDSDKAIELLQPFTETTRASIGSQFGATGIGFIDKILTKLFPNMDTKTVNIIKEAMKEVKTPKELEQSLIRKGIDKQVAAQTAKAMEKSMADDITLDEKQAKDALTEDIDRFFSENVIPADIKKKFTYAKKHGTAQDIEALKQEVIDLAKSKKMEKRKGIMSKGIEAKNSSKKRIAEETKLDEATTTKKDDKDALTTTIEDWAVGKKLTKEQRDKLSLAKKRTDNTLFDEVKDSVKKDAVDKRKNILATGIDAKGRAKARAKEAADEALVDKEARKEVLRTGIGAIERGKKAVKTNKLKEKGRKVLEIRKETKATKQKEMDEASRKANLETREIEEATEKGGNAMQSLLNRKIKKALKDGDDAEVTRWKKYETDYKEKKLLDAKVKETEDFIEKQAKEQLADDANILNTKPIKRNSKGDAVVTKTTESKQSIKNKHDEAQLTDNNEDLETALATELKGKEVEDINVERNIAKADMEEVENASLIEYVTSKETLEEADREGLKLTLVNRDATEAQRNLAERRLARLNEEAQILKQSEATVKMRTAADKAGLTKEMDAFRKDRNSENPKYTTFSDYFSDKDIPLEKLVKMADGYDKPPRHLTKLIKSKKDGTVMPKGRGSIPLIDTASEVMKKELTQDMTDTLATSRDKTRTIKKFFTDNVMSKSQIETIYKKLGKKVPNDITRSTKWTK